MTTKHALILIEYTDMSTSDRDAFIAHLPRLHAHDAIPFACGPGVACFNVCCGDLDLPLSPYDVMRLRVALDIGSSELLRRFGEVSRLPDSGFPVVSLRMQSDLARSCPFVREIGCSVYENRPGACRAYPLGREAEMDADGKLSETVFMVRESHCLGFDEARPPVRVAEYFKSQGLPPYAEFDNRYVALMHLQSSHGHPLNDSMFERVFTAAYKPDELTDIDAVPASTDHGAHTDRLSRETARLASAFEWARRVLVDERG